MIDMHFVECGRFGLCLGAIPPGGELQHPNADGYGATVFAFLTKGSATANGETLTIGINDLSRFLGAPIRYVAGSEGVSWVALNPARPDVISYRMLDAGVHTITPSEKTDVCALVGSLFSRGKEIGEHKFAQLRIGETYEVTVPEGAVGVVLKFG